MNRRSVKLQEIATIKGGKRLPAGHDFVSNPTDHLYIRARDIGNNKIYITDPVYISDHTYNKLKSYVVNEGDIAVTIVGANIGDVGYVTSEFDGANLTENAAKIDVFPQICNPKFLSAQLSTAEIKKAFQYIAAGSAQGKLGLYKLKGFEVVLPPIKNQDEIASILASYDDLIENNKRRIALLEQAARLLYKEWFVRLRFPGHEHVKVIDGVPNGWEKKCLEDLAQITMGQSPESQYYNEDGIGLPFHQGVSNFGMRFPTDKIYCTVENRIGEAGDILFSVRAPVGRINITLNKIVIGRGLAAIRSKWEQQNFLFYQLKNHFFKEDMLGGGAIFPAITKKDVHGVEILTPTPQLIELFQEHVATIDRQIETLHKATDQLIRARDLLLPRLMNGELAV